ncbi:radical SAM protein with 4Fe4S-binding SPASM domain [Elusimicrobium posterum]|uniref:radical SAM protein n=1 Tax=Elusimicrobium posterum TaxID=3116653 RepID=UPI003C76A7A4
MSIFSRKLNSVVWELTLKCNARCQHCGSSAGKTRDNELTLKESLEICDQLADLKCERINLMGGELFLNPDWKKIAQRLSKNGILVSVITNGILLNKENIDFLKEINTETIGISVDGGLARTHDSIRQVPGLFDKIFEVIPNINDADIPVVAITTLTKKNILELNILKEKLLNSAFKGWQFQIAVPYGRMSEEFLLSKEEYYIAGLFAAKNTLAVSQNKFQISCMHDFGYYSKTIPLRKGLFSWTGCPAGKRTLGLRSDGKVHGCLSMQNDKFAEKDLRKNTLKEIFYSKDFCTWNKRLNKHKQLKGFCKECEYGLICLGGCSDTAHSVTGTVGNNPFCYHAIESEYKNLKPSNDFENIFKNITSGKMADNGKFYLNSGEELCESLVEQLNIEQAQKQLLKLLAE